jgi:hypothetical protein
MRTHSLIDDRSLAMAESIVAKIDSDPTRAGFAHAKGVLERWIGMGSPENGLLDWEVIMHNSWDVVRLVLLDHTEDGKRLRQSSPFTGILTAGERRSIYREFMQRDTIPT